ncbi:MAG: helix-turn-helix domain-containing protein [Sandaracinaceae bacterium]
MPHGTVHVGRDERGMLFRYDRPVGRPDSRHGVEALMAALLATLRHCSRLPLNPERVEFASPPPSNVTPYDEFYGVPVGWSADSNRLWLGPDAVRAPMTGAHQSFCSHVIAEAEKHLRPVLDESPLGRRVTDALRRALHAGDPTLGGTARALGVSARSLQRQLRSADIMFRELRSQVLHSEALRLLEDEDLSVEQVAERLGYATRSSFDRAFHKWTGITAAEFRRGNGGS